MSDLEQEVEKLVEEVEDLKRENKRIREEMVTKEDIEDNIVPRKEETSPFEKYFTILLIASLLGIGIYYFITSGMLAYFG